MSSTEVAIRREQVVDRSLDDLAAEIRAGHSEIRRQLERTVREAIRIGGLLLEAKTLVEGSWTEWVEEKCELSPVTAALYMRVHHYERVLPDGVNLSEAVSYLRGLPSVDGRRSYMERYPDEVIQEARRLRSDEGLTYSQIGDRLQVSKVTVGSWIRGKRKSDLQKERARKKAAAAQAKRALLREASAREAKKQGGSIGKAYSLMRQLQQELDRASEMATDKEVRLMLRRAWSHVNGAEADISRALGIDYGSWRDDKKSLHRRTRS